MILAAGLTPAWQQILRFDTLELGAVNRAREAHWCASGKVFNVAIALAQLGAECHLISPIGTNVRGQVERELSQLGVRSRLVVCDTPTRVCTTLLESASGTVTELVENARPLEAEVVDRVAELFQVEVRSASVVVLTGSLPGGTPVNFYRDLAAGAPGKVILDARGPELLAALEARPFVVKPNREELAQTMRQPLTDDAALVAAMRGLNARGAQWVVITEGKRAVWAASTDNVWRLQPLAIESVVNPIGCGDCLTAGLAWGLSSDRDLLQSLAIGIAAAAQNAAQLLPARVNGPRALDESRRVAIERVH
ncbi:MAG TPA: PfkB family carbohydrate kinase [Pirellulales bacterium]|nr:PfkB family carbohydrate kinase [Pirellulales bacterium]